MIPTIKHFVFCSINREFKNLFNNIYKDITINNFLFFTFSFITIRLLYFSLYRLLITEAISKDLPRYLEIKDGTRYLDIKDGTSPQMDAFRELHNKAIYLGISCIIFITFLVIKSATIKNISKNIINKIYSKISSFTTSLYNIYSHSVGLYNVNCISNIM